jgi:hypothetical protein
MKKLIVTKIVSVLILLSVIYSLSSCKTSGYGCRGKDSWEKTVRRINRPY